MNSNVISVHVYLNVIFAKSLLSHTDSISLHRFNISHLCHTTRLGSKSTYRVTGVTNMIFPKKRYSYTLRSMIIWLKNVIKFDPLYKRYAIKFWTKVIWVTGMALAMMILKLPAIFERVPVYNELKLYKMVQNVNWPVMTCPIRSWSQGSKIMSNFKQAQVAKVTVSMCWIFSDDATNWKKKLTFDP